MASIEEYKPVPSSSIVNNAAPVELEGSTPGGPIAGVAAGGAGTPPVKAEEDHRHTKEEERAAVDIQRSYRGYRERRQLKGHRLTADERWMDAVGEAIYRTKAHPYSREERIEILSPRLSAVSSPGGRPNSLIPPVESFRLSSCSSGEEYGDDEGEARLERKLSPSRDRWARASYIAKLVQQDDPEREGEDGFDAEESVSGRRSTSGREDKKEVVRTDSEKARWREKRARKRAELVEGSKVMDMQYFLELVDLKHRYGSNLKVYHDYWKAQPTHENFFYWLDYGEGKDVNLTPCPRAQLETERVKYLSREERQAYLVKIDSEGKLRWAKNDEKIDTSEKYKNSKKGIVPLGKTEEERQHLFRHNHNHTQRHRQSVRSTTSISSTSSSSTSSTSSSSSSSSSNSEEANRYTNTAPTTTRKQVFHFSPTHILNRLLRKTTKKNTWIFVADTSFRLYVGIKQSGAFQHSSFLHGARVSAAGLIKIKNGKLKSLSPLSGHYRPPASNFRKFLHSLSEAGVDMSGVKISKSYAVLIGLEAYSKIMRGKKKADRAFLHHKYRRGSTGGDFGGEEGKRGREKGNRAYLMPPAGRMAGGGGSTTTEGEDGNGNGKGRRGKKGGRRERLREKGGLGIEGKGCSLSDGDVMQKKKMHKKKENMQRDVDDNKLTFKFMKFLGADKKTREPFVEGERDRGKEGEKEKERGPGTEGQNPNPNPQSTSHHPITPATTIPPHIQAQTQSQISRSAQPPPPSPAPLSTTYITQV